MEAIIKSVPRTLQVGDVVVYVSEHYTSHPALVTKVWYGMAGIQEVAACNLVFVASDEAKEDPYGRQIERRTSVCHKSVNPAEANCWCWPGES